MILTIVIATILILTFLLLSAIHIYWAIGGRWGSAAAIPQTLDGTPIFLPGIVATLLVAMVFLFFCLVIFIRLCYDSNIYTSTFLFYIHTYGIWIVTSIFFIRAIGDFRYVGFYKTIKGTLFAKMDTLYYSPLCLAISILALILAMRT